MFVTEIESTSLAELLNAIGPPAVETIESDVAVTEPDCVSGPTTVSSTAPAVIPAAATSKPFTSRNATPRPGFVTVSEPTSLFGFVSVT